MKKITLSLFFVFCYLNSYCQDEVKYDLDSIDLVVFEEESKYLYKLLFESILNIIDDQIPIGDRYISRSLLGDLFSNSNAIIWDYIDTKDAQGYKPSPYGFKLLETQSSLPLYYKKFKFSDEFKFDTLSYRGLNAGSSKTYAIYSGKLFVMEKLINSDHIKKSILNNPSYNAYEEGLVKEVLFEIAHVSTNEYELRINQVSIVSPNYYKYKDIRKRLLDSPHPWSDEAEKDYVESLVIEAKTKGIELIPSNWKDDIILDSSYLAKAITIDTTKYQKVGIRDIIIPGVGQMKFGRNRSGRVARTTLYSGLFIASAGYATYSKIQSNKWYKKHKNALTIRKSDNHYDKANRHHKHFVVSTGITALTFISNAVHLKINNSIQLRRINEAKGEAGNKGIGAVSPYLDIDIVASASLGSGLKFTLNF